jgi:hypothetical protein
LSTVYRVKVLPLEPLFSKTTLEKYSEDTKLYELYKDKFTHDIRTYPTFKLVLFDKFDNSVTTFPAKFATRLYFENPVVTAVSIEDRFEFCKSGDWIYVLCENN